MTADDALRRLTDGNRRYVAGCMTHPDQSPGRRVALVGGQRPFAAVLGCADSRVPPEVIFDQGLGNLFVVRVAGNVADDLVTGSLEYAAEHLHVPLVVVLGHSSCSAVAAAASGHAVCGALRCVVDAIAPALRRAQTGKAVEPDKVARANACTVAERLRACGSVLSRLVLSGGLRIVPAFYDLSSGEAAFLD